MKMEQSVPKRRHIKFRRRGITQKKTYDIFRILGEEFPWTDLPYFVKIRRVFQLIWFSDTSFVRSFHTSACPASLTLLIQ
jgi:hypothetical protein